MAEKKEVVPINRFRRMILAWDYFGVRGAYENDKSNEREESYPAALGFELKEVKNNYSNFDDYISTYEPFLFEEVKAQIVQFPPLTTWKLRNIIEWDEDDGFHYPSVSYFQDGEDEIYMSKNDLLLLSEKKFTGDKEIPSAYAFALVDSCQPDRLSLRLYLDGEFMKFGETGVLLSRRLLNMRSLITSQGKVEDKALFCHKICNLSTISEEYMALRSIGSSPLRDVILKPAENNNGSNYQAWAISAHLRDYVNANLNESQKEAIQARLSRKPPFVLIQGPPGSGKTKTILVLLSVILHSRLAMLEEGGLQEVIRQRKLSRQERFKHFQRASPWLTGSNPRDEIMPKDGDDGFFPTDEKESKPIVIPGPRKNRGNAKVLVCAPSDSALDDIVLRLLENGVCDENGCKYNPKIVRIGLNANPSVQSVTLDELVKQKLVYSSPGADSDDIRDAMLDGAAIVFSTLSFSGSPMFRELSRGFDVLIIDEAAQAVEPTTLIPLASARECKQVFMVGDPLQLPAIVRSPVSLEFGYGTSLFGRFQKAGCPVTILKMQDRMHPEVPKPHAPFFSDENMNTMESAPP